MGGAIGGLCGILGLIEPEAAGGGFNLIPIAAAGNFSVGLLLFIFIARVVTTLLCFSSGAPGGIFAPMLALGTLLGTAFGMAAAVLFPSVSPGGRYLCDCRDGGADGGVGARPADGDCAGAGDDR
ncbi:chloride channel protein [Salmonella enterica subsp. enterica serovar Heidelberg str. RI-11-014588]|nr:chloride channel protein [Salmonella enterica subsp. enterica serovar Heidelberg str. RI-11-014588]